MRIKSYFAPSVQAAIALARREFGDDVTLVTSHVAASDVRHLGEYEVVFAIEEASDTVVPEPEPAAAPAFQDLLREAIATKPSMHEGLPEKLEQLRLCFIEIGLEPPLVRALLTMIERSVPFSAQPIVPAVIDESASSFLLPETAGAGPETEDRPQIVQGSDSIDPSLVACFVGAKQNTPPSAGSGARLEQCPSVGMSPDAAAKVAAPPTVSAPRALDPSLLAAFSGAATQKETSRNIVSPERASLEITESQVESAAPLAQRASAGHGAAKGLMVTLVAAGLCAFGQRFR
jgi:hypothetical protein